MFQSCHDQTPNVIYNVKHQKDSLESELKTHDAPIDVE